jgi:OHCU decarboxylase
MAAPPTPLLTLPAINTLGEEAFVTAFGALFERSPWVARTAWRRRPFQSMADLHLAFEDAIRHAEPDDRVALIRAHPELAGREAEEGELTDESKREQATAGLDRLTAGELRRLTELNRAYRERFGFPLIVCVREHTKGSILAWGEARLERSRDEEVQTALLEIGKIAHLRLHDIVVEPLP